jgi:D-lactate dehydrogenase
MKIVIFENEPWMGTDWHHLQREHVVEAVAELLTAANIDEYADADIISTDISVLDEKLLARFKNLKMIAARTTGVDLVDRTYCRHNGITLCNVPAYAENAVAEHVFALLLCLNRHMLEAISRSRRCDFSWEGIQSVELYRKTLAVIGTGAIGRRVSQIAKGFGMQVVAFDLMPDHDWAETNGITYMSLDDALPAADIITLHIPSTPETYHLIADDQFKRMKEKAVIINTARGELVDTGALLRALHTGKIAAAGLDVLPQEHAIRDEQERLEILVDQKNDPHTLLANLLLLHHPNVIMTPHSAFFSKEAVQRLMEVTLANIEAFIEGNPRNVVG